jgi:hypothetical protein
MARIPFFAGDKLQNRESFLVPKWFRDEVAVQPQGGGIRQPRATALGRCQKGTKSPNGARFGRDGNRRKNRRISPRWGCLESVATQTQGCRALGYRISPPLGLPGVRPEQKPDSICQFSRLCVEHVSSGLTRDARRRLETMRGRSAKFSRQTSTRSRERQAVRPSVCSRVKWLSA